jgi:hypothetical protein
MSNTSKLNFIEVCTLIVGGITMMIAAATLILGDNVLRLAYSPDVALATSGVSMEKLGSTKEYLRTFDFYNAGNSASANIKVVIRFASPDIKISVESDEDVKNSQIKSNTIEIFLERMSPRSHLRVSALSKSANALLETYYVDDKGKTKIDSERHISSPIRWSSVVAIALIIFVIMVTALVFIKRWERGMSAAWEISSQTLTEKMDNLKSDLAELRGAIDERPVSSPRVNRSQGSGGVLGTLLQRDLTQTSSSATSTSPAPGDGTR